MVLVGRAMCEGGWEPVLVFFIAVDWSPVLMRYLRRHSFCYRLQRPIEIRTDLHPPNITTLLAAKHRAYIKSELDNFDFFIYQVNK